MSPRARRSAGNTLTLRTNVMTALQDYRADILRIAEEHGARNVRVFGSEARGDAGAHSDLDLLVDMEQGRSLLDLVGLGQDLEDLLGRRVDVLTSPVTGRET